MRTSWNLHFMLHTKESLSNKLKPTLYFDRYFCWESRLLSRKTKIAWNQFSNKNSWFELISRKNIRFHLFHSSAHFLDFFPSFLFGKLLCHQNAKWSVMVIINQSALWFFLFFCRFQSFTNWRSSWSFVHCSQLAK